MDGTAGTAGRDNRGWNANLYDASFAFIWRYGSEILDALAPQPGERVLDLGCGTGHLTWAIAERGAEAVGLDSSPEMVEQARRSYPDLRFVVADAAGFDLGAPFDAVFSNATLHWIPDAGGVAASVARALRPGGRFVAEFGGRGNVTSLVDAIRDAIAAAGYTAGPNPWYFPSIGEYATLMERHGLEPVHAALFDRPTRLDGGEAGVRLWIEMFAGSFMAGVPGDERAGIVHEVEARLRPTAWRDSAWYADYRRLRVVAVKR